MLKRLAEEPTLNTPEKLFAKYVNLRKNGLCAEDVLRALGPAVENMPASNRHELKRYIVAWENGNPEKTATQTMRQVNQQTTTTTVKRLGPQPGIKPLTTSIRQTMTMTPVVDINDKTPPFIGL